MPDSVPASPSRYSRNIFLIVIPALCRHRHLVIAKAFLYVMLMEQHNYYVYILTSSDNAVFYVGVTNNLIRRVIEHKIHRNEGFTSEYNVNKLVYFELFANIEDAIKREKQLKRYKRLWKFNLVNEFNADWVDLSEKIGITREMIESAKNGDPGINPG